MRLAPLRKAGMMLALFSVVFSLLGCGQGPTGDLTGYVMGPNPRTRKLQPVMKGRIRVYCGDQVYSGDVDAGRFEVKGLPTGDAKITVESPRFTRPPDQPKAPPWFEIPERFSRVDTTPLTWTIQPGSQKVHISLLAEQVTNDTEEK